MPKGFCARYKPVVFGNSNWFVIDKLDYLTVYYEFLIICTPPPPPHPQDKVQATTAFKPLMS
jgi:hypothetical protein